MILQKIWSYITFRKQPDFDNKTLVRNGDDPENEEVANDSRSYLRMMHGINRISIIMFILGMIIVIIKLLK